MKPKVIICILLLTALLFQQNTYSVYADTGISVVVDGKKVQFDQQPVMESGRVLVPMRAIFEALGYSVEWDGYYNSVSATMKSGDTKREVYVHVAQLCMSVYENQYPQGALNTAAYSSPVSQISFYVPLDPIQSPVKNVNGRILLPTRAIAEALGCKVVWESSSQTVVIDTAGAKITPPQGWVEAIEAHSAKYAPDFLGLKAKWVESERKNQLALAGDVTPQIPVTDNPSGNSAIKNSMVGVNQDETKVYTVYSDYKNRAFEYSFTNPESTTTPPIVGSVPAKILIDESHPTSSYQDSTNQGKWIHNLTEKYSAGTTGGCNWYAGGRFWEVYGIPFPHFDKIFDTVTYLDKADLYSEFITIRDVNDIRPYSMAVYVPMTTDSTPHVLFVEYVERDADGKPVNVYFTEGNTHRDGQYHHQDDGAVQVLNFATFIQRGRGKQQQCIGYIIPNPDFYK